MSLIKNLSNHVSRMLASVRVSLKGLSGSLFKPRTPSVRAPNALPAAQGLRPAIVPALFSAVIIIILCVTNAYFGLKVNRLSRELIGQKNSYEKINKEAVDIRNNSDKIKTDFTKLQKDFQTLSVDRENLLAQVKQTNVEQGRIGELEGQLEKAKKELGEVESVKKDALEQNASLKGQLKDILTIQKQLIKEREQLAEQLSQQLNKPGVKETEQQNAGLKKENSGLVVKLKEAEGALDRSMASESQLKGQVRELTGKVDRFDKDYSDAVRKNREFEQTLENSPTKFVELARQNRALIKETANMHYNLGVFYTQQKDYSRAAAEFEKTIELAPDDAYAHFNLGYIYAEYLVNKAKAIEHFRRYLRFAKKDDKDVDWVKKYIITWQTWEGKEPVN